MGVVPKLPRPQSICVRNGWLYALHSERGSGKLIDGLPGHTGWQSVSLLANIVANYLADVAPTSAYVTDPDANFSQARWQVRELLLRFGTTQQNRSRNMIGTA